MKETVSELLGIVNRARIIVTKMHAATIPPPPPASQEDAAST
jgi:hypothetical protein